MAAKQARSPAVGLLVDEALVYPQADDVEGLVVLRRHVVARHQVVVREAQRVATFVVELILS